MHFRHPDDLQWGNLIKIKMAHIAFRNGIYCIHNPSNTDEVQDKEGSQDNWAFGVPSDEIINEFSHKLGGHFVSNLISSTHVIFS